MYLEFIRNAQDMVAAPAALPRILLIDDDRLYVRRVAKSLLGVADLRIADGRASALDVTSMWQPDVTILDMFLRDGDAMRLPDELRMRASSRHMSVIYLVKGPGALTRFQLLNGHFLGVVQRDTGTTGLLDAIRSALTAPSVMRNA